jgi:N-methylhydantoinase A
VATNLLINRSGAKTGLITTKGFEDTILIMRARGRVAGLGDLARVRMVRTDKPEPIVPKPLIKGVRERIDYKGRVVMPLQREDVVRAVTDLADSGVKAIAVSLLWSFSNPIHEKQIREIIRELQPDIHVTISSELSPLLGEYERTATTAINAYLAPATFAYFSALEKSLRNNGLQHRPLISQAYGGSLPIAKAGNQAVTTIASGPVGGVMASRYLGELLGHQNVLTTDVGGTSFDVGLILDGVVEFTNQAIIEQYTYQTPRIEVESIGTGGGSIAWIEPFTGLLKVGPTSAGAVPGPVCYDYGGVEPTVSDADLILGYLNPDYFLGGRVKLNAEKARQALEHKIAKPLDIDPVEAAAAIYDIVNAKMADLIRKTTIERGYDPRDCALFAYGGAGPVHAGVYAEELGVKEVIVPITAAVHSAMGVALSDVIHSYSASDRMVTPAPIDRVNGNFEKLEMRTMEDLIVDGFEDKDILIKRYVGMKYRRQVHELIIPAPLGKLSEDSLKQLVVDFETMYEKLYGQGAGFREAGIEIATFKVEGIGKLSKPVMAKHPLGPPDSSKAIKAKRDVFFRKLGRFKKIDIFDMGKLKPGNIIDGPAVVETPVTTIVIHPEQRAEVDPYQNVVIRTAAGS